MAARHGVQVARRRDESAIYTHWSDDEASFTVAFPIVAWADDAREEEGVVVREIAGGPHWPVAHQYVTDPRTVTPADLLTCIYMRRPAE